MTDSGQRVVPVKETLSRSSWRRTLAVVLLLSAPVSAQDAGVVLDAPLAEKYPDGSLLFNPPGAKALDAELKRLQGVERLHKGESWITVVAISSGVGLVVGVLATLVVLELVPRLAPPATPPSL